MQTVDYIIENMKTRRSTRSYNAKPVERELIDRILEAARYAPSALNKQPWEFVVITDAALIRELSLDIKKQIKKVHGMLPLLRLMSRYLRDEKTVAAIKKTATSDTDTVFYNAPALILIASGEKSRWVETDCAIAAQNAMLAAHALGLGSCFIGRGMFLMRNKKFIKDIGLKQKHKIYATLAVGYPEEVRTDIPQRRKDNLICWKG